MAKIILKAEKRVLEGRKVKNLRKKGILPGNVYGKKIASESVQVDMKEFEKIYKDSGETTLLTLDIAGEIKPVLIHNLQLHPVTEEPLHVDFLQVDLKEKVEADIPVEFVGESPAEKQGVGTVVQYINEIKVEALPTDLPEKFEIDVSTLSEVDQSITINDLKYDKSKIEVKSVGEEIVAKVEPPQKEEEPVVATPVEGEAGTESAPVEGSGEEKPAEGNSEAPATTKE